MLSSALRSPGKAVRLCGRITPAGHTATQAPHLVQLLSSTVVWFMSVSTAQITNCPAIYHTPTDWSIWTLREHLRWASAAIPRRRDLQKHGRRQCRTSFVTLLPGNAHSGWTHDHMLNHRVCPTQLPDWLRPRAPYVLYKPYERSWCRLLPLPLRVTYTATKGVEGQVLSWERSNGKRSDADS